MSEASSASRKITLTDAGDFLRADGLNDADGGRRFGLLIFFDGEAQLRLIDESSAVVIGREPPSEIVISDPSVSRQHARFTRRRDEVWLEDLDSRNGTFRAGRRIQRERLDVGAEIAIGRARVVLAATRPRGVPLPEATPRGDNFVLLNARMKRLYADVVRAAAANVPVLVLGETGVGKEHIALTVHRESPRRDGPFVAINCAAIPGSLLESTLFGHERGAFTGASARTAGVFERANGGVLFLDEIGDLGVSAQVALLRAIETQRISRVGSSREIPTDVRVVAATHCDLEAMVQEDAFRKDLYYRLNGISLEVPPLRERRDEIEPLVRHFLQQVSRDWGMRLREMTPEAMEQLRRCSWPGNVRQLRHAVERGALLAASEVIGVADLPDYVTADVGALALVAATERPVGELSLKHQLRCYERALIEEALRRAGGNRQAAAKLLRIPLRTLFRRIRACTAPGAGDGANWEEECAVSLNRGQRKESDGHPPS
jgi:two-component system response regulator AtoC